MNTVEATYEFEELPMLTENGIEAGLVNGTVDLTIYPDAGGSIEWFIDAINLEGYRDGQRTLAQVERGTALFNILHGQIEADRLQQITDFAVREVQSMLEAAE